MFAPKCQLFAMPKGKQTEATSTNERTEYQVRRWRKTINLWSLLGCWSWWWWRCFLITNENHSVATLAANVSLSSLPIICIDEEWLMTRAMSLIAVMKMADNKAKEKLIGKQLLLKKRLRHVERWEMATNMGRRQIHHLLRRGKWESCH